MTEIGRLTGEEAMILSEFMSRMLAGGRVYIPDTGK